jgi:8-oxo-dGTP pyrophosphatase MutT (NUDIX family)
METKLPVRRIIHDPARFKESLRHILSSRVRRAEADPTLTCAAVLVPMLFRDGEWHVVVTQRTEHVEHHKGQVSFPGGACEVDDVDLQATALRETFEEIGVPPNKVEILGSLDDFRTITRFVVTPFVAVIPYPIDYRLQIREVESVLEVPLSFLLDPQSSRVESREHEGQLYQVLFWDYGAYTIWGATAQILKGLLDLLD